MQCSSGPPLTTGEWLDLVAAAVAAATLYLLCWWSRRHGAERD